MQNQVLSCFKTRNLLGNELFCRRTRKNLLKWRRVDWLMDSAAVACLMVVHPQLVDHHSNMQWLTNCITCRRLFCQPCSSISTLGHFTSQLMLWNCVCRYVTAVECRMKNEQQFVDINVSYTFVQQQRLLSCISLWQMAVSLEKNHWTKFVFLYGESRVWQRNIYAEQFLYLVTERHYFCCWWLLLMNGQ